MPSVETIAEIGIAFRLTANFIDQLPAQARYLKVMHESGLSPRLFHLLCLGFAVLCGLVVAGAMDSPDAGGMVPVVRLYRRGN